MSDIEKLLHDLIFARVWHMNSETKEDAWKLCHPVMRKACEVITEQQSELTTLRAEIERLDKLVYAPGRWHCPKCKFTLLQSNLNTADGTITARDKAGDKCPNCDSPLWRVSWKQESQENQTIVERFFDESRNLRAELAEAMAALLPTWEEYRLGHQYFANDDVALVDSKAQSTIYSDTYQKLRKVLLSEFDLRRAAALHTQVGELL